MSQAETLQDIYLKIADIYESFCDVSITQIVNQLVINSDWTANIIEFDNPNSGAAISGAQTEINNVLNLALNLAKNEASQSDATVINAQGEIVSIPSGSPITLLPKLINLLVLYKAPLKFLMNTLLDYIKEVILEHIKRKLLEKNGQFFGSTAIASTQLIKIPSAAIAIAVSFNNLPAWVSKRFEPANLNKSIVQPQPSPPPDMSKFLLDALGTCQIGFALTGTGSPSTVFWDIDTKLEYSRQIINLPKYEFVNHQRYAYLYLEFANTCSISFLGFA